MCVVHVSITSYARCTACVYVCVCVHVCVYMCACIVFVSCINHLCFELICLFVHVQVHHHWLTNFTHSDWCYYYALNCLWLVAFLSWDDLNARECPLNRCFYSLGCFHQWVGNSSVNPGSLISGVYPCKYKQEILQEQQLLLLLLASVPYLIWKEMKCSFHLFIFFPCLGSFLILFVVYWCTQKLCVTAFWSATISTPICSFAGMWNHSSCCWLTIIKR